MFFYNENLSEDKLRVKVHNLAQEKLLEIVAANESKQNVEKQQQLLEPDEVIKQCLRSGNRELALEVFDVFAWTNLLEECWKNC